MANAADTRCRLCLVTPSDYEAVTFAPRLADALAGGDVASLIITAPNGDPTALEAAARMLVPIAAARGVAALIHNDTRAAARTNADGVHIDSGIADLAAAMETLRNRKIVGAGGGNSRHEALEAGAAEPDYVFFGHLHSDAAERIPAKALDLAAWWSSVTVIPAIVMGGRTLASVDEAAASGIDFVALSSAVWNHALGAATAISDANGRLVAGVQEPVA